MPNLENGESAESAIDQSNLALAEKSASLEGEPNDDDVDEFELREVDVFISYRLNPDAAKATAFRTLLRKTLDPVPNVFVSGDGGLVPSNIALKAQLLTAFHQSKAVVAIITADSKTREWVIYEAGAAWGCQKLYAPLLVEVEPETVSSTIVDFVATKAREQEEVRRLVDQVALRIGCRVKGRFGVSFASFVRQLATGGQQAALATADDETDHHARARSAWSRGDKAEAERLWAEGCSKAGSDDGALATIRLQRLVTVVDDGEEFERLLGLESPSVQASPNAALWRGIMADHDHVRIDRYRDALQRDDIPSGMRSMAREWLATALFRVGRDEEATALLLEAISGADPIAARSEAAEALCKNRLDFSPLSMLMLSLTAYKDTSRFVVRRLASLAVDQQWPTLAMYFAAAHNALDDDGSSRNTVGRAALSAQLPSVAFEAFSQAADRGASVAKANLGVVHGRHLVPAAGLSILRQHEGPIDAQDTDFAHRVRADLEKMVADEQRLARETIARGRKLVAMLLELASRGWSKLAAPPATKAFVTKDDPQTRITLRTLQPFSNLFEVRTDHALLGLASQSSSEAMIVVAFNLGSRDNDPRRIQLDPAIDESQPAGLILGRASTS